MEVTFDILRRKSADEKPYIQTVTIERGRCATVAEALDIINTEKLIDDPVQWERSCKQKKCGACAMLINGRPRLACDARLDEFLRGRIKLEPLKKFPCVRDLMVDRSVIFANLMKLGSWLDENAVCDDTGVAYDASKCLQCGCCLEVASFSVRRHLRHRQDLSAKLRLSSGNVCMVSTTGISSEAAGNRFPARIYAPPVSTRRDLW